MLLHEVRYLTLDAVNKSIYSNTTCTNNCEMTFNAQSSFTTYRRLTSIVPSQQSDCYVEYKYDNIKLRNMCVHKSTIQFLGLMS